MLKHNERKTPGSASMPAPPLVCGRSTDQQPMAAPATKDTANMSILVPGCLISRRNILHLSGYGGGLNGSTQHFLAVYSQESENLKFVVGVDLSAALLCSDPTGNTRSGLFSSGSIVVTARWCFRSSRVAKDSADHRSKLSHLWPP